MSDGDQAVSKIDGRRLKVLLVDSGVRFHSRAQSVLLRVSGTNRSNTIGLKQDHLGSIRGATKTNLLPGLRLPRS